MALYISNFFATNFISFILLACLLYLALTDKGIADKTRKYLFCMLAVINVMMLCDYVDITVRDNEMLDVWSNIAPYWIPRNICSGIGYAFRPALLMLAIGLLYHPKRIVMALLSIPAAFNLAVSLLSIKTGWVYSINSDNEWNPGPLRYVFFAISFFYLFLLLLFMVIRWKRNTQRERIALFFVMAAIVTSIYLDVFASGYQTLMMAIVCSFFMYYLCLYTNKSNEVIKKQDSKIEEQRTELLVAQIQPQFIYGTLNSLYDLCNRDTMLTRKSIHSFALYLRGILDFDSAKNTVCIEDELEQIKLYAELLAIRFPELKISFDIHDGGYDVPQMVLQPIIENTVSEGVKGTIGEIIAISASREDSKNGIRHIIKIRDNIKCVGRKQSLAMENAINRIKQQVCGNVDVVFSDKKGATVTIVIDD